MLEYGDKIICAACKNEAVVIQSESNGVAGYKCLNPDCPGVASWKRDEDGLWIRPADDVIKPRIMEF